MDEVAEWLGHWSGNPMASARVGPNLILVDTFFKFKTLFLNPLNYELIFYLKINLKGTESIGGFMSDI